MKPDYSTLIEISGKENLRLATETYTYLASPSCVLEKKISGKIHWQFSFGSEQKVSALKKIWQVTLKQLNIQPSLAKVTYTRVKNQNWALKFQQSLKPIKIAGNLVIKACDTDTPPKKLEANTIYIPYGLAFGTGEHATTQLCARLVYAHTNPQNNVLDLGCGTGILAIIAAKCGAKSVDAIDNDPIAIDVAKQTTTLNQIKNLSFGLKPKPRAKYDLIIANILLNPLIELAPSLIEKLKPGGLMILSGITYQQKAKLRRAYQKLSLIKTQNQKGWSALLLQKK